nr:MAG TPA: hypothetical protein [Caudoviricetes sp.]
MMDLEKHYLILDRGLVYSHLNLVILELKAQKVKLLLHKQIKLKQMRGLNERD